MDEDILGQSIYLQWTNRQTRAINIPTMNEPTDKSNQYTYDGRRQTKAINLPTMDEQTENGNQYTCDGRTDSQGQSIHLRWMKTDKGNQYTYDGRTDRQGQSIYLQWTNRQTRAINLPTMDEQAEHGYQHTYDGRRQTMAINIPTMAGDRQWQSIYLRWPKTDKGNQYTYDG